MNDLPDAIHWNRTLLFADDTKCFKHIKSPDDEHYLQNNWPPGASIPLRVSMYHLIKQFLHHNIIASEVIPSALLIAARILINDNLNWNIHHNAIFSKAYGTLGLVQRTFSSAVPTSAKVKLYTSLIRS